MGLHEMRAGLLLAAAFLGWASAQSGDCKTCTRFMTSLAENLDSETAFVTMQDSFRSTLCSALPDESMAKTCMSGINGIGKEVSRCALLMLNLPAMCSHPSIGLCPATDNATTFANKQVAGCNWWNRKEAKKDCAVCTHMVSGKSILTSNQRQMKDLMFLAKKQICDFMDDPAKCKSLVDKHGSAAVGLMTAQYQPDMFCCDIGFCEGIVTSEEDYQRYATMRKSGADLNVFKNSLESADQPNAVGSAGSAFGKGLGGDVAVSKE